MPRGPIVLAALAFWAGASPSASALSVEYAVTPANLDHGAYRFSVSAQSQPQGGASFHVTITAKTDDFPSGSNVGISAVTHSNSGSQIVPWEPRTSVTLKKDGRSWTADFTASPELLKNTNVCCVFTAVARSGPNQLPPAQDFYEINLHSFLAAERSENQGNTPAVKITFSYPLVAPTNDLARDALYPPGFQSTNYGPFSKVVNGRLAAINVNWADPARFGTEQSATEFLREMLASNTTDTFAYHVWSWGDSYPDLAATAEHKLGKPGEFRAWTQPGIYWAYKDGDGRWWWGAWNYPAHPTNEIALGWGAEPRKPMSQRGAPTSNEAAPLCELVRTAINEQHWSTLRQLANPAMRASEYIDKWEKLATAGSSFSVGRASRIDKVPDDSSAGATRYTYTFDAYENHKPSIHQFQVIVRHTRKQDASDDTLLDFWEFGW